MVAFIVGQREPVRHPAVGAVARIGHGTAPRGGRRRASCRSGRPTAARIGFFTNSKLKTIAATGGRAEMLCDAPGARGGAWSPSNIIVFAPDAGGPLFRIPASGGTPTPVDDPRPGAQGNRPPLPGLPARRRALPLRGAARERGRFDIIAGLACRLVAHADRVDGQRACLRGPWLVALRPAGGAGRAALRRADAEDHRRAGVARRRAGQHPRSGDIVHCGPVDIGVAGGSARVFLVAIHEHDRVVVRHRRTRIVGESALPPGHYETGDHFSGRHAGGARSGRPRRRNQRYGSSTWPQQATPITSGARPERHAGLVARQQADRVRRRS